MRAETISLKFPTGGLHKRYDYQHQPAYTTPDCLNVRPEDVSEGRQRGGSRPGLVRPFPLAAALGTAPLRPVRLLNSCQVLASTYLSNWQTFFEQYEEVSAGWLQSTHGMGMAWYSYGDMWWDDSEERELHRVVNKPYVITQDPDSIACAAVLRNGIADMDATQPYSVSLMVGPHPQTTNWASNAFIYAKCANGATADPSTNGVEVLLRCYETLAPQVVVTSEKTGEAGNTVTYTGAGTAGHDVGWFTVVINGTNLKAYWRGTEITTGGGYTIPYVLTGTNLGMGLLDADAYKRGAIYGFVVQYTSSDATGSVHNPRVLIASAAGKLYEHTFTTSGAWSEVNDGATEPKLADDRQLMSVEHNGKLYIADWQETIASGTTGSVTDDELTDVAVTDWTTEANTFGETINKYDHVCVVYNCIPEDELTAGTYAIQTVAADKLTLSEEIGSGACSWKIIRAPKHYTPATQTLAVWRTETYEAGEAGGEAGTYKGQLPYNCHIIARYRDRIFLAGDPEAPHIFYASRRGNPLDFDYGQPLTDPDRAYVGQPGGVEAGSVSEAITAMIPISDDYLLMACANSLYRLTGDAAYGGILDSLSYTVGIPHRTGWCRTPEGATVFLSHDGLYFIGPGPGNYPQPVSKEVLPRELTGVSKAWGSNIFLGWDNDSYGINIFLTHYDGQPRMAWWLDWSTKGLYPQAFITEHEPTFVANVVGLNDTPYLLLGGRDGYLRQFSRAAVTDDGTNFSSRVVIGPVPLGGVGMDGMLEEVVGVIPDENSASVTYELRVGDTPLTSLTNDYVLTGTWAAGVNYAVRPDARGRAFSISLSHAGGAAWTFDEAIVQRRQLQQHRKG